MAEEKSRFEKVQQKLDYLINKWWFYVILIVLSFIIPTYASKGYNYNETGKFMYDILSTVLSPYRFLQPVFHIATVIIIILVIVLKNKMTRIFNFYVALNYFLAVFLQNITLNPTYGFVILGSNMFMILLPAFFWLIEGVIKRNNFAEITKFIPRYWVVPLAILAFWFPIGSSLLPSFDPILLLYSDFGLAVCLITPVFLALMSLYHPNYNVATVRMTSFTGIFFAIYNMINPFTNIGLYWWLLVLHIPLLSISLYCFILTLKRKEVENK